MGRNTKHEPMTSEQFLEFTARPENHNRLFELVRGEAIEVPPPTDLQVIVCANVARLVGDYEFKRSYGYLTTNDSGVILERDPDTVRCPDVALYEGDQEFSELEPKYDTTAPTLAVEVLTPSDKPRPIVHKVFDYLRCGVNVVWLIDPKAHTIDVYHPAQPVTSLT